MRHAVHALLVAATSVALGACGSIDGPEDGSVDVYVLQTVQGVAIPYSLTANPSIAISGREVTISPDGTFSDVVELTVANEGWSEVVPSTRGGTYAADGSSLRLEYTGGRILQAERTGRTLTLHDTGLTFVLAH